MKHQHDLPYDFEDFGMPEDALKVKYPSGHPTYTIAKWNDDPEGQDATNGYWDWAMMRIAADDDSIPSNESEAESKPDTVPMNDMDAFIRYLSGWHQIKVAQLEHMMHIPEGAEATMNDGTTLLLEGARHEGFVLGLSLALMELGALPFVVEMEGAESAPVHATAAHVQ